MAKELTTIDQNKEGSSSLSSFVFATAAGFDAAQRMAEVLSKSDLVPKEYKGNQANCLIALEVAQRTLSSPLMVMQNLYVVYGRPSWSSQFIIASVNTCGRFRPLRFDLTGDAGKDDRTCIAWTVEKDVEIPDGIKTLKAAIAAGLPVLESPPVSILMAKEEGWYGRQGSKWKTMPELMLRYRAAAFFGRLYTPEILMGMQTQEESFDIGELKDVTPVNTSLLDKLNSGAGSVVDNSENEEKTEKKSKKAKAKAVNPGDTVESAGASEPSVGGSNPSAATQHQEKKEFLVHIDPYPKAVAKPTLKDAAETLVRAVKDYRTAGKVANADKTIENNADLINDIMIQLPELFEQLNAA